MSAPATVAVRTEPRITGLSTRLITVAGSMVGASRRPQLRRRRLTVPAVDRGDPAIGDVDGAGDDLVGEDKRGVAKDEVHERVPNG